MKPPPNIKVIMTKTVRIFGSELDVLAVLSGGGAGVAAFSKGLDLYGTSSDVPHFGQSTSCPAAASSIAMLCSQASQLNVISIASIFTRVSYRRARAVGNAVEAATVALRMAAGARGAGSTGNL